jgi:hypothetical protein
VHEGKYRHVPSRHSGYGSPPICYWRSRQGERPHLRRVYRRNSALALRSAPWPTPCPTRSCAERGASCPRCHGRVMDESACAYLLGLYLGDWHITRGRRNVFVLSLFCSDDWPGLLAAARSTMSAVMPSSGVFSVQRQGCTEVKSASKHWPCLFPQHGPGVSTREITLKQWQFTIVEKYPGEFAGGLFHSDGWRGVNRVRRRLVGGDRWYEYSRYLFDNESKDILRLCAETLDQLEVAWRFPGRPPYLWPAGRLWRGWMSSWGPNTEAVRVPRMRDRGSRPR